MDQLNSRMAAVEMSEQRTEQSQDLEPELAPMDSHEIGKMLEFEPSISVPFSHPDPNHIHHCPEASCLYHPVTIQTATRWAIVGPGSQNVRCSCNKCFRCESPYPFLIDPVHELDRVDSHETEIVLWDIQYRGTAAARFCFLRRCAFKYLGPERIHWLEKRYKVYGLEGKEFWVDGEKAHPLYEFPEM